MTATALARTADFTGFAVCLEEIPMSAPENSVTLTTTSFRRPVLADNVCNAKAGCLYPNNYRMIAEARKKGFTNALVADAMGNVAESATANVFIVKDGVAFTPSPTAPFWPASPGRATSPTCAPMGSRWWKRSSL
jgi:branched-chain amino acid aminotransferase